MGEKQTMGGDNAGVVLHPTSQSLIYFLYPVRGGGGGGDDITILQRTSGTTTSCYLTLSVFRTRDKGYNTGFLNE
jgi:hypothetical protein